ncbi:type II toxin-antitoxin system VapC family toxin [Chelativorans xinjiangense]|uniref:type II toxin-antitoxin system VapC family toxin n=1 Tax=Chelativorans xinjiangense TaxID=2681485 RepID=UPI001914E34A|nr:type II toxin-antitoxin system VapC family toxin [Chelativorans xinjiangense]
MGPAQVIVDASAILAILLKEPEEGRFADLLAEAKERASLSPVNYLEVALRVDRGDMPEASQKLDEILHRMNVEIADLTPEQALLAREAYRKYGKGNHKAKLNLGDFFAYALAKARGESLLFKGNDFSHTDVEPAL